MQAIDVLLIVLIIAVVVVVIYLIIHSLPIRPHTDPYAEFDRWQRFFNAGIEARNCGLDPEDNPGIEPCDYDAWLDGWKASDSLRRLQKAARGREVA